VKLAEKPGREQADEERSRRKWPGAGEGSKIELPNMQQKQIGEGDIREAPENVHG
jgi:hypothetical protein